MRAAHKKAPPARTGLEVTRATTLANNGSARGDAFATLTDRLENIRFSADGNSCRAQCPSCTGTSRALSVTRSADGVLIHCFAMCPAADIVAACGLELADLFDQVPERPGMPNRERRKAVQASAWRAALVTTHQEAELVLLAAAALQRGPLPGTDHDRLQEAVTRLQSARLVLL